MNELADGIDFHEKTEDLTQIQALAYSQYITACLANVHGIDGINNTSITHADLHLENIWFVDGLPKIADFGNAKLLEWNVTANKRCDFVVKGDRKGMFFYRSPEVETSAMINDESRDLYQLAYILGTILHNGYEPYDIDEDEAMKLKLKGILPRFNKKYEKSDDPGIRAVVRAIKALFSVKPEDRPRAWQVAKDFKENMPWKDINEVIDVIIDA
jgi:serine/threonine protein kinase